MRVSRWFMAAAMVCSVSSALAAPKSSWDGTWTGAWGGTQDHATSILIENNKVVSYDYGGSTTPVSASRVTAKRVSYGDNGVSVVMMRTGANSAFAKLHTDQGDATAKLSRQ